MKKLMAIGAAALALTGAAFALDISGNVYLEPTLLDVNIGKKVTASALYLKTWEANNSGNNYAATISANMGTVGASFGIGDASGAKLDGVNLWVQPSDMVRVEVGCVGTQSVAYPQWADWSAGAAFWPYGVEGDFKFGSVNVTTVLESADYWGATPTYWFNSSAKGYAKVGDFWADATYNSSIGQFQVYATKGATVLPQLTNWGTKAAGLQAGVAYANMPYQKTGYFAEAGAVFTSDFKSVTILGNVGGQYIWRQWRVDLQDQIAYGLSDSSLIGKGLAEGLDVQVTYDLNGTKLYGRVDGLAPSTMLDKSFELTAGCEYTYGSIVITTDVVAEISAGKFTEVKVPMYLNFKF